VPDQPSLLRVEGLSRVFVLRSGLTRTRIHAVHRVSFEIAAGCPEIFSIVGESGSGKSTLARMLLGLLEPTEGHIIYHGRDLATIRRRNERLAFMKAVQPVFQNPFDTFNPLKKIETYLYETVRNFQMATNAQEADRIVDEALRAAGLSLQEVKGRYPNELSGGQLQRASVARALITRPSLIIADEPVSMMDASLRMSVVNLFKELKEAYGVTVIYITHDLATAYYVSDRIAVMLRGNVVEHGPVEKVLAEPLHPYTRLLKESVPEPDPTDRWETDVKLASFEGQEFARAGCKFAGRCPYAQDVCLREEPPEKLCGGRTVKCHRAEEIALGIAGVRESTAAGPEGPPATPADPRSLF